MFLLFDEEMNGTWYPYSPGQNGNTRRGFRRDVAARPRRLRLGRRHQRHLGLVSEHRRRPKGRRHHTARPALSGRRVRRLDRPERLQLGRQQLGELLGGLRPSYNGPAQARSEQADHDRRGRIGREQADRRPHGSPMRSAPSCRRTSPRSRPCCGSTGTSREGTRWPWEIESSAASQQAFATGISSSYYAPGGSFGSLHPSARSSRCRERPAPLVVPTESDAHLVADASLPASARLG